MVNEVKDNAARGNDEALSALMDDQAQDLELRRMLRDMQSDRQSDSQLQERWYRHNLVRSVLGGDAVLHRPDFAGSVRAAIDAEAGSASASGIGGWRRNLGSFAVAASVAAVVVLGGQQLAVTGGGENAPVSRVASLPAGVVNTAGAVPVQASFGTRALPVLQPADRTAYRELARQRLRRYSQQHAEHASLNTPQGMVPFARVPVTKE